MQVRVVPAGTAAAQSFLSDVWPGSGAVVGMPAGVKLTALDGHGNARATGGDRFNVDIPGLPKYAVSRARSRPARAFGFCSDPPCAACAVRCSHLASRVRTCADMRRRRRMMGGWET